MPSLLAWMAMVACVLPGAAPDEAPQALAVSRWSPSHELFVEIDPPVVGRRIGYHAHVTRLADNHAVTAGTLAFHFEQDGFVVESHTDSVVARPGVFAAEAPSPGQGGTYQVVFTYDDGEQRVTWDPATVEVGVAEPLAQAEEAEGDVAFLKESQWQIPFGTELAAQRPLAPLLTAGATVSAAPATTTIVAAPVEGLLSWADELPVVGRSVVRGERLATLIPAGAAEHWSRLRADLATARVDQGLAAQELSRIDDLAGRDLVPDRRLQEARAGVERAQAELAATRRRVSALTSGGAGAVVIRAPADGLLVSVGAAHGVAVAAGTPLVSVATGTGVLIEGYLHQRAPEGWAQVASLFVMRGDWPAPRDLLAAGGQLLTERLVFDPNTLSAPVAALVGGDLGLVPGDVVELQVAIEAPRPRLAVPRSAVVEVSGQDVVFVQVSGESFARRRVTLGVSDPAYVEVLSGVQAGDRVVVQGGFDVHVASLSGALESHRH